MHIYLCLVPRSLCPFPAHSLISHSVSRLKPVMTPHFRMNTLPFFIITARCDSHSASWMRCLNTQTHAAIREWMRTEPEREDPLVINSGAFLRLSTAKHSDIIHLKLCNKRYTIHIRWDINIRYLRKTKTNEEHEVLNYYPDNTLNVHNFVDTFYCLVTYEWTFPISDSSAIFQII